MPSPMRVSEALAEAPIASCRVALLVALAIAFAGTAVSDCSIDQVAGASVDADILQASSCDDDLTESQMSLLQTSSRLRRDVQKLQDNQQGAGATAGADALVVSEDIRRQLESGAEGNIREEKARGGAKERVSQIKEAMQEEDASRAQAQETTQIHEQGEESMTESRDVAVEKMGALRREVMHSNGTHDLKNRSDHANEKHDSESGEDAGAHAKQGSEQMQEEAQVQRNVLKADHVTALSTESSLTANSARSGDTSLLQRFLTSRRTLMLILMSPRAQSEIMSAMPAIIFFVILLLVGAAMLARAIAAAMWNRKDTDDGPRPPTPSARPSLQASRGRMSIGVGSQPALSARDSFGNTTWLVQREQAPLPLKLQVPPVCAALVMPHSKAEFLFLAESLRNLGAGRSPEPVLGPSGNVLLYARLPAVKSATDFDGRQGLGVWLELSSSSTTLFPHAGVGPFQPGVVASTPLEIRGSAGKTYGQLEYSGSGWCVLHTSGLVLFSIDPSAKGISLACIDTSGIMFATAIPANDRSRLQMEVLPGADTVLAILCMLAVMVMSPHLSNMR